MMYKISFAQSESEYVGSTASTLHNKVTERGGIGASELQHFSHIYFILTLESIIIMHCPATSLSTLTIITF